MQSQDTSVNRFIHYNMLLNNKEKMYSNQNITSTRHFSTSTMNYIPKKIPYGDMCMETTSNMQTNKTILSEITKTNQEFKQNLNENHFNMDYQVAADMLKQDSTTYYEKKNPESKPTPENNSSYKVDFYPVVLGVANFITGIFNNITGGGWVFSNKSTTSDKEEEAKMITPSHSKEKEDISKYSIFESPQTFFFANEISLNNIKSMSENDVTVASINSQVEYQNKTVAAEQSALLNSFQSCRQHSNLPSFISDQSTHDNINESENIPQNNKEEENKEMNIHNKPNCAAAVEKCEDKLAKIKDILKKGGSNKQGSDNSKTISKLIRNRRRRVFVPQNSIENNSIKDNTLVMEDSVEQMQNMMVTNFSHPGLVVEPEIINIEPAMTLVNKNMNAADEVDFCATNDMKICHNMTGKTSPKANLNENDHIYLDSLKSYAQDCLLGEADGTIEPKNEIANTLYVIDSLSTSKPEEITDNSTQTLKKAVISSCEDKIACLKEMLSRRLKTVKDCNVNTIQDKDDGNHGICKDTEKIDYESYEQLNFGSEIAKKSLPKAALTKGRRNNKKHKNPNCRTTNKDRGRRLLRRNIDEDISLGCDLNSFNLSSSLEDECQIPKSRQKNQRRAQDKARRETKENPRALNIPESAFDEVKGKFKKSVSDCSSDDSFIIVFSESPATSPIENTLHRQRMSSDTGSEDSFIICFESDNENGNCYTNTDIFNESDAESDSDSETETSDSDSDLDVSSDGDSMSNLVNCSFGNSMSRTISDLTDESLYADDSVLAPTSPCDSDDGLDKYGEYCEKLTKIGKERLMSCMNGSRKQESDKVEGAIATTDKLVKKVRFSEAAPQVLVLRVWAYAARAARVGPWERAARDRVRFKRRICDVDMAISWVLKPQHRTRVKFQRFMPWWNALRRQEVAEKKKKAEDDKIKQEEEDRIRLEKESVTKDNESQDNIEPGQGEIDRQEESGVGHDESVIICEETKGNRQEKSRLCNGNSETDNINRLNGSETSENCFNKNGNVTNKENISKVEMTVTDKQKTLPESNKQNLYAIQIYDDYKGEKFIKNCINSKKILVKN